VIDIQETALGGFEKYSLILSNALEQKSSRVHNVAAHSLGMAEVLVAQDVGIEEARFRR